MGKSTIKYRIHGLDIPNMPWEERPKNTSHILWRF